MDKQNYLMKEVQMYVIIKKQSLTYCNQIKALKPYKCTDLLEPIPLQKFLE